MWSLYMVNWPMCICCAQRACLHRAALCGPRIPEIQFCSVSTTHHSLMQTLNWILTAFLPVYPWPKVTGAMSVWLNQSACLIVGVFIGMPRLLACIGLNCRHKTKLTRTFSIRKERHAMRCINPCQRLPNSRVRRRCWQTANTWGIFN